jgi:hypothetical protein
VQGSISSTLSNRRIEQARYTLAFKTITDRHKRLGVFNPVLGAPGGCIPQTCIRRRNAIFLKRLHLDLLLDCNGDPTHPACRRLWPS